MQTRPHSKSQKEAVLECERWAKAPPLPTIIPANVCAKEVAVHLGVGSWHQWEAIDPLILGHGDTMVLISAQEPEIMELENEDRLLGQRPQGPRPAPLLLHVGTQESRLIPGQV